MLPPAGLVLIGLGALLLWIEGEQNGRTQAWERFHEREDALAREERLRKLERAAGIKTDEGHAEIDLPPAEG